MSGYTPYLIVVGFVCETPAAHQVHLLSTQVGEHSPEVLTASVNEVPSLFVLVTRGHVTSKHACQHTGGFLAQSGPGCGEVGTSRIQLFRLFCKEAHFMHRE